MPAVLVAIFVDLTGHDFPLGSLVGAEATSCLDPSGGSPAAAGRAADPNGVMEAQAHPERTESPKQRKAKAGVNLRKSLAWDSAFFTSEGLLRFRFFLIPIRDPNSIYVMELSPIYVCVEVRES